MKKSEFRRGDYVAVVNPYFPRGWLFGFRDTVASVTHSVGIEIVWMSRSRISFAASELAHVRGLDTAAPPPKETK